MPPPNAAPAATTPRLESGDHLAADEFLSCYEGTPDVKKAELIDGVVYVASPTRWNLHAVPHGNMAGVFMHYCSRTPGVQFGQEATVRLDPDNVPQPDLALIVLPSHGGQTAIDDDEYIAGAPELICEISASTRSLDRNAKLRLYQRSRVREYLIWRVEDGAIDWFVERDGKYIPLPPDPQGVFRSQVFPGLWLDAPAILAADLPRVLQTLDRGLATPEHANFVARLATASKPKTGQK